MEFLLQDALANLQENQTQTPATEIGQANIKVIGCGGGGGNVANWLYKKGVQTHRY